MLELASPPDISVSALVDILLVLTDSAAVTEYLTMAYIKDLQGTHQASWQRPTIHNAYPLTYPDVKSTLFLNYRIREDDEGENTQRLSVIVDVSLTLALEIHYYSKFTDTLDFFVLKF